MWRTAGFVELPLTAKKLATTGKYDALIAIGCIIRGETRITIMSAPKRHGFAARQMDTGFPLCFVC